MPRRKVSDERRTLAARQAAETAAVVRSILPRALRLMAQCRLEVAAAYGTNRDPTAYVQAYTRRLAILLLQAMKVGRLLGIRRSQIVAPTRQFLSFAKLKFRAGDISNSAVEYLRKAVNMTDDDIKRIEGQMEAHALRIARGVEAQAVKKVREAVAEATESNLHVKAATELISDAFKSAGLTPDHQYTFEAIFRTQTQLAYAAGREDFAAQPEIQEILWGYQYVTVGDDRVRPEHEALDGVTLPKDDPFWDKNSPPNGFGCRCQRIEVFEPEPIVPAPTGKVEIDGKEVEPGADRGFRVSARSLFNAIPPGGTPAPKVPAAPPAPAVVKEAQKANADTAAILKGTEAAETKSDAKIKQQTANAERAADSAQKKIEKQQAKTEALKKKLAELQAKNAATKRKSDEQIEKNRAMKAELEAMKANQPTSATGVLKLPRGEKNYITSQMISRQLPGVDLSTREPPFPAPPRFKWAHIDADSQWSLVPDWNSTGKPPRTVKVEYLRRKKPPR